MSAASPAERFAAARRRAAARHLRDFASGYDFPLDPFQVEACEALEDGRGVLVAAPTGAGKTVVGEFAVHLALATGRKCFYTTPIKALSNQKFAELQARHGEAAVGLLTGDNAVNGDAPVVVMTTEVLRNMLYADSRALDGLGFVVMDEVHYLADRFRGAVWEEVILTLPADVQLVSLSATVSNAEEFADWLVTVRGETAVVVEEHRPVPLFQHVLVGHRMHDLFVEDEAGRRHVEPELLQLAREESRLGRRPGGGRGARADRGGRRPRSRIWVPSRPDVVTALDRGGLLPAIVFVFSRKGCAQAVEQCLRAGLRLTSPAEREAVRAVVRRRTSGLAEGDLRALGYWEWLEGLERGVAAHHAGMLPTFKETVEELFAAGLVKAVFATETLALGVNMPARSVVLERLTKWNGETHADVTPGEYTQLTGRAGRRGIDVEGHAVVVWQPPDFDPTHVAGLASTRTYPLRSSFRASYNMAVNVVGRLGRARGRQLLEESFAQFQADRGVVGLARQLARNVEALEGYREAATCSRGDAAEYAALRQELSRREAEVAKASGAARRAEAAESLAALSVGDVVRVPTGRRAGLAVVVEADRDRSGDTSLVVVTEDRWGGRLSAQDFPVPVTSLGRVRVPRGFDVRDPRARRDLASTLRNSRIRDPGRPRRDRGERGGAGPDAETARLRRTLRAHPVHGCDDREDHVRWAERAARLEKDTAALRRRMEGRTGTVARTFDRVCSVLDALGYLAGDEVPPDGQRLARLYSEADLLVAECLRDGVWEGLSAAELAALLSCLVFESRRDGGEAAPKLPGGAFRGALRETTRVWSRLRDLETGAGLSPLPEPDPGFAWAAYRWARGATLEQVLDESVVDGQELAAGDFVRWTRQVLDLLGQVATAAAGTPVARTASTAAGALRRGVVAHTGLEPLLDDAAPAAQA